MTVSLKHAFTSPKTDGADATLVQPSNWNAEHTLELATNRLLGRTTAGTGVAEEISVAGGLTLSGGVLTATGGGGPILESQIVVSQDYTISSNTNGFSVGPVTVAAGYAVTVPTGQVWAIWNT
jgi:hypothetical protein